MMVVEAVELASYAYTRIRKENPMGNGKEFPGLLVLGRSWESDGRFHFRTNFTHYLPT